jgi:hypothetical protein
MTEITRENHLIDIPDLNRFRIGDHVIVDAGADNDRFEGVIIGIELQRVYASKYLVPSITLLHDGCTTDGFKPSDCRKVQPPPPQTNVAVETVRALETAAAPKHMIEAACQVINDRGKGNNVTIADVVFMIDAAIRSDAPSKHPDDLAVDRFAAAMKAKLAKKRDEGKSGWEDKDECSWLFLSQLLREHVEKGDPVDVGNLAMMLHQREEQIASLLETLQGE